MTTPAGLQPSATGRSLWRARVDTRADHRFLHADGQEWTYAEADDVAARYATTLATLGVGMGTRVLVGMENSARCMFVHLAILRLGAVLIPIQPGLTFAEVAYQVGHSGSNVLIADETLSTELHDRHHEFPAVTAWVTADATTPGDLAVDARWVPLGALGESEPREWDELHAHSDQSPAMILYTSGSTGKPKGVVLPAGCMPSVGEAFSSRFEFGPQDTFFQPLTMAHAIGALSAPSMAIYQGASIAIAPSFSPRAFWGQVAASGGTHSILFPAHLTLLVEATELPAGLAGTTLQTVITHAHHPDYEKKFGGEQALVWGMTETGAMSVGTAPGDFGDAAGYVGAPMIGVSIQIRDDDGEALPAGEVGEICLRHRHAMLEYLNDPAATAATLANGWIRSGDFGVMSEAGNLYYRGRFKNMIKRAGENISPEEIENALAGVPAVAEAIVFGVEDRIRTEEVAAVIVLRDASTEPEILHELSQTLVRWKLPRYIQLSNTALPRLGNGKIDRAAVKRGFEASVAFDREME